ncbi:hypothetical protein JYU34_022941 [Plutella xylostella]|uniref:Uncharacterized protein n=1 Tax=Plutella xylostella TaxID=51655 RepID=A0ABQ7PNY3_PLUXY|nr:hypothetical protein JYU34_022941 [Plutella xylostella]
MSTTSDGCRGSSDGRRCWARQVSGEGCGERQWLPARPAAGVTVEATGVAVAATGVAAGPDGCLDGGLRGAAVVTGSTRSGRHGGGDGRRGSSDGRRCWADGCLE